MRNFLRKFEPALRPESSYMAFFVSLALCGLSYGLYKGAIDNYLAEVISMGEFERGVAEFFRELPGVLLVLVLAVLYTFSAELLYKAGLVIMVAGMALHGLVPPIPAWITAAICFYSFGDHISMGMRSVLSLQYARPGHGGEVLGVQKAFYEGGNLLGYIVIGAAFLAISGRAAFRSVFFISAAITALGTVAALRIKGATATDKHRRRFYFRRKFSKYYMLEVFYGARKQVFFTFGPYVLILFYGAGTATISALFAISSVFCFIASPLIGRLIDRIGYKTVMVADTLILVLVCFAYGFAHHIFSREAAFAVCCASYVLDAIISLASMASSVYVADLADGDEELRATISTGLSVNHVITVLIALFGGWIWSKLGIETLFMISAACGLLNSAYAATITTGERRKNA